MELARDGLRPVNLEEFTGQSKLKQILKIALTGASSRSEPLGHTLFIGPPGLGKTTLAQIIAMESSKPLVVSTGPSITKVSQALALIQELDSCRGVLFIDEIHR